MDLNALRAEVQVDPAGIGYAGHLPEAPGQVVELLNARVFSMPKATFISARGVMSAAGLGPSAGARFMDKLEALAATVPEIKWALKFLQTEAGIDIGGADTQAILTSLIGAGGITAAEIDGIKAMAMQPASRVELLFGDGAAVTEADLRAAGVV